VKVKPSEQRDRAFSKVDNEVTLVAVTKLILGDLT